VIVYHKLIQVGGMNIRTLALGATAVSALFAAAPAMAQDDAHAFFALGVNGGVTAIKLPAGQNGVLTIGNSSGGSDPYALGYTGGFNAILGAGKLGNLDVFVGANVFGTYANASTTRTQNFSGVGLVEIPGSSTPANASISLTTSRAAGAAASTNVVDNNPQGGGSSVVASSTSPAPGNGASASEVSSAATGNSFVWSAMNTQVSAGGVAKSLAVGAVADTSGSMFLAVGDLDGLSIKTSTQNTIAYAGLDVPFGIAGALNDRTVAQAYIGPSYRFLDQWNKTNFALSVDLPEVAGTTVVHPLYSLDRNTNITSNYLGGVIGGSLAFKVTDTMTVGLAGEGSLYYAVTGVKGGDTVTIAGGSGVVGLPFGSQTVSYGTGGATTYNTGIAYAIRGQASTTIAINNSLDLTLAGSVDYLSRVARPGNSGNVTYTANATDANVSWSSSGQPLISFGDMWAFTLTGGLTGHF
jgi:hypothetical protein